MRTRARTHECAGARKRTRMTTPISLFQASRFVDRLGHMISTADLIASDAADIDPLPAISRGRDVTSATWDAMRRTWRVAASAPAQTYGTNSASLTRSACRVESFS